MFNLNKKTRVKHKKTNCSGTIISILILIIVLIISLSALYTIKCIFVSNETYIEEGIEATLLSTGLSIIALAVAVWTGLNIANAIQKNEIELLKNKLNGIQEAQDAITLKPAFLEELLKTQHDYASWYFYTIFSNSNENDYLFSKMLIIEQLFCNVIQMHNDGIRDKIQICKSTDIAINTIDDYINSDAILNDNILKYLSFRKGEMYYYRGYSTQNSEDFKFAIRAYESFLMYDFNFADDDGKIKDFSLIKKTDLESYSEITLLFAAYIANTISNAYCEMIRFGEEKFKNHIDYAIVAGEASVGFIKYAEEKFNIIPKHEIYFRNLGCLYERIDNIERPQYSFRIFECYKQAFYRMINDGRVTNNHVKNVFHVLLSYYFRYINSKLFISDKKNCYDTIDASNDTDIVRQVIDFIDFSEFSLKFGRTNNFLIVMNGFAYSDLALLELLKNPYDVNTINHCIDKMQNALDSLKLINNDDNYKNFLNNRFNYIISAFSENGDTE